MTSLFISIKEFTWMGLITAKVNFTTLLTKLVGNTVLWYILRLGKHQEQKAEVE